MVLANFVCYGCLLCIRPTAMADDRQQSTARLSSFLNCIKKANSKTKEQALQFHLFPSKSNCMMTPQFPVLFVKFVQQPLATIFNSTGSSTPPHINNYLCTKKEDLIGFLHMGELRFWGCTALLRDGSKHCKLKCYNNSRKPKIWKTRTQGSPKQKGTEQGATSHP